MNLYNVSVVLHGTEMHLGDEEKNLVLVHVALVETNYDSDHELA